MSSVFQEIFDRGIVLIFWIFRPLFWAKWFKSRSSVKPSLCGLHFSYFRKVIANNSSKCASTSEPAFHFLILIISCFLLYIFNLWFILAVFVFMQVAVVKSRFHSGKSHISDVTFHTHLPNYRYITATSNFKTFFEGIIILPQKFKLLTLALFRLHIYLSYKRIFGIFILFKQMYLNIVDKLF